MHMNKLTEAKFLLQTVRFSSGNDPMDEPYAKSYERASEILAEFESQKEMAPVNKMRPSSPLPPLPVKTNSGAFTEFPYEKRADFGWRRNHFEPKEAPHCCYGNIPRVPFTQPRRGDHRKGHSKENGNRGYCRKLSFATSAGNEQSFGSQNVNNYYSEKQVSETGGDWRKNSSSIQPLEAAVNDYAEIESVLPSEAVLQAVCGKPSEKSWADMVEEDEELEFERWRNDENVDSNIIHETPKPHDNAEKLCQKMELIDFGSGYLTQPEKTARRSLCFDHDEIDPNSPNNDYASEVLIKDGDFSANRRRRLKVFQDITSAPGA